MKLPQTMHRRAWAAFPLVVAIYSERFGWLEENELVVERE